MSVDAFVEFVVACHLDAQMAFDRAYQEAKTQFERLNHRRFGQKLQELEILGLDVTSYTANPETFHPIEFRNWGGGLMSMILERGAQMHIQSKFDRLIAPC